MVLNSLLKFNKKYNKSINKNIPDPIAKPDKKSKNLYFIIIRKNKKNIWKNIQNRNRQNFIFIRRILSFNLSFSTSFLKKDSVIFKNLKFRFKKSIFLKSKFPKFIFWRFDFVCFIFIEVETFDVFIDSF